MHMRLNASRGTPGGTGALLGFGKSDGGTARQSNGKASSGTANSNRAKPAQPGATFVSLEALEAKLNEYGLVVQDRLGKGSRAQVFRAVAAGETAWSRLSLAKDQVVAVKTLLGASPRLVADAQRIVLQLLALWGSVAGCLRRADCLKGQLYLKSRTAVKADLVTSKRTYLVTVFSVSRYAGRGRAARGIG